MHACIQRVSGGPCVQPSAKREQSEQQDLSSFEARTVGMAVRHVVLAVHGIGQRMGGRTIADDAQAVRRRVNSMLDDYMPDEIGKGYIQVLPIQWRKNLDLEVRPPLPAHPRAPSASVYPEYPAPIAAATCGTTAHATRVWAPAVPVKHALSQAGALVQAAAVRAAGRPG